MKENDPGVQGAKLSKSGDNKLEDRNKSYNKVMDAQVNWIRAIINKQPDAADLHIRWQKKSEWHEKEFGW